MAQQTFSGVPGAFAAGAVLTAAEQELIRDYMIAQIKEGMTGDTGEVLPMIMDLTNNRIVLDSGGLEFSDATTMTTAPAAGLSWSGSTANGLGTYGSSSSVVSESTATYDGTTLELTASGGGLKLDNLDSSDANTLDDFEEGSCTLAFTPASGTITMDGGTNASYTKIGRMITVSGKPIVSSVSSPSGATTITGLPFTLNASAEVSAPSGAFKIGGYSGTINHTPTSTPHTGQAKIGLIDGLTADIDGARFQATTEATFTFAYQI